MDNANEVISKIEFMNKAENVVHLKKGYSGDLKYIFTKFQSKFLIRFNKADKVDRCMPDMTKQNKQELVVNYMNSALEIGVRCPKVFDFGYLENDNLIYIITSYIEGESAHDIVKELSNEQKYKVGYELGSDIKKLHTIDVDIPKVDWERKKMEPLERNLAKYNEHKNYSFIKLDVEIEKTLLEYISDNKYLLKNRDITLIHNDVHDGNIIINNGEYAGLIDFNEIMYGDKYFDHKYLTHSND